MRNLFHTINVTIPSDAIRAIAEYRTRVLNGFSDQYHYFDDVSGAWHPHIALLSFATVPTNTDKVLELVASETKAIHPFSIELSSLSTNIYGTYVFLEPDIVSRKTLTDINAHLFGVFKAAGLIEIPTRYSEQWDALDEKSRHNLTTYGRKYEYAPHISLAKLNPDEVVEVMKEAPMEPVRFTVSGVYVTLEKDGDRYATIAEYSLGHS